MAADDLTNSWTIHGDPTRLAQAAASLRRARPEQVFGARSADQYIMPGIARLLDCLAYEMRHNGTLGHDVVSAATEVSGHIIAFLAGDERIR
jgi:hypothetical protein